jgi:TolB-like protein
VSEHHQVTDTPNEREVESTWDKLRRRKVVQWGIVYAAGAWGLLQGLSYISLTFDWPRQIQQLTTLALLVGLPIVLILAWYHGDRGEQRVSRTELTIITLLFLVGGGIFWRYQGAGQTPPAATPLAPAPVAASASPEATGDSRPSIAVLPFENLSGNAENAYFVSGMQDLILTNLSKIRELKVISRTSTEKYASHPDNLKTVGAELGVGAILEGSVQRAGDHVLINVQLIDVNTDTHLWAEVYNRKIEDVFAVEQEVAKTVAEALQATLSPTESAAIAARPTEDAAAYDLFLRAQYLFQNGSQNQDREELAKAIALYRQAIAQDPGFALAEARLSIALSDLYWNGGTRDLTPQLLAQQSMAAMAEAKRLQPDLPEGNLALAYVRYRLDLDYPAAVAAFDAVLAARPGESYAMYGKALPLRRLGRFEEAIAALEAAAGVSPRDSDVVSELAVTRWMVRRTAEAEAGLRHALALVPANVYAATNLSLLRLYRAGDIAGAWAILHGDRPELVLQRVELLRFQRKHAEALRLLASIPDSVLTDIAAGAPRAYLSGRLHFEAGRRAEAERLLREAKADLEARLGSLPANYARGEYVRLALADTEAMLGEEAAALRTAQQALARQPIEKDAVNGPFALAQAAQVYARLGRADLVLPALERLRLLPGADEIVSASTLKLDPAWDKVRADPRFQAEIRRFAEFDQP